MSRSLRRYALLSVAAAVVTIGMKAAAYFVTGSVGLLSDALESGVNLLAAVTAYLSLIYAARPADETHTYGHEKIEFFASGLEGVFIVLAGLGTAAYGGERLWTPQPLQSLELGAGLALAATVVNLVVARVLLRVGRAHNSVVLQADGHHLMADVYLSAGIVGGLVLVAVTGYAVLDPLLAVAVGLNILVIGVGLMRRSFNGLMDHALPPAEQAKLAAIRAALPAGTDFHAVRTRQAGAKTFAEFHLLVPGGMSVRDAHDCAHKVEDRLCDVMPGITVTIHVEPIDDAASWEAIELARLGERPLPSGAAVIELLSDPALRTVAMGTAAIGGLAGFVGTFAVVRRQSLQGDAVSHAALPGLAAAFLLGARSPVVLVLGAALAGWAAMALVGSFSRSRRLTFDAALGGTLAVFFGLGLAPLTYVRKHVRGAAAHGLERYLFGQAATLREDDVWAVLAVGGVTLAVVLALWKPFQLLSFDPDFAAVQGVAGKGLDALLTALIVVTVVIGLQAVGVVLMSSLLVAPAVAAKQWLHRLGPLSALAAALGAVAGFLGTLGGHVLSREGRTVPTGPMIVIVATGIVAVSLARALVRPRVVTP